MTQREKHKIMDLDEPELVDLDEIDMFNDDEDVINSIVSGELGVSEDYE